MHLDCRRHSRFMLVLGLHMVVGWWLVHSKVRIPAPQSVDTALLVLISRPLAMSVSGSSAEGGAPALSFAPASAPARVDFVPVVSEEAGPPPVPRVSPMLVPAPAAATVAAAAAATPAGHGKSAGSDEVDYESLPAAMLAIECETPPYPYVAMEKGEEGTTRLALLIDPRGYVIESRVVRSSKSLALDRASRDAIAKCQFMPAMRNGVAAQGWVILNYIWTIRQKPGVIH